MSDQRDGGIVWCDETWNPIRGCSRISEGCRNCYAETMAARFSGPGQPYEGLARRNKNGEARWTGIARTVHNMLDQPLRWERPRRIFVNSMSDLFHESLSNEEIAAIFGIMAAAPRHTFQVLTKRPQRMLDWFEWFRAEAYSEKRKHVLATYAANELGDASDESQGKQHARLMNLYDSTTGVSQGDLPWPLPNVWLGVSVENQAAANERLPILMEVPAALRFVSFEPLLGPVDATRWIFDREAAIRQAQNGPASMSREQAEEYIADRIDWAIVGGESGKGARPMHPDWARSLIGQCKEAGIPAIFKQWGDWAPYIDESKYTRGGAETPRNAQTFVNLDGTTGAIWMIDGDGYLSNWTTNYIEGESHPMTRVGKRKAGDLLDGVEYKAFPESK